MTGSGQSPLQFFDRIGELADILDLGLQVHRNEDVELVLDIGDEIEHRQAVPFEVLGEARVLLDRDSLLVEGFDLLEDFG